MRNNTETVKALVFKVIQTITRATKRPRQNRLIKATLERNPYLDSLTRVSR